MKKDKRVAARQALFKKILTAMKPIVAKFGKNDVRLAVNYWNRIELERNRYSKTISEAQKQLEELKGF
jgi:hypothetical protein